MTIHFDQSVAKLHDFYFLVTSSLFILLFLLNALEILASTDWKEISQVCKAYHWRKCKWHLSHTYKKPHQQYHYTKVWFTMEYWAYFLMSWVTDFLVLLHLILQMRLFLHWFWCLMAFRYLTSNFLNGTLPNWIIATDSKTYVLHLNSNFHWFSFHFELW